MKLSNLRSASDFDVKNWLEEELNLTTYQKERMRDRESIRFSPFYFYKKIERTKNSFLWRLTLPIFLIYVLILIIANPIKWVFTGRWGYGRKFLDKFHSPWQRKIGV